MSTVTLIDPVKATESRRLDSDLDKVYHQIARYVLQLSQMTFSKIGAISKEYASNTWHVTRRPLTYNMNRLVTIASYPVSRFHTALFDSLRGYLRSVANKYLTHLWTQLIFVGKREIAQDRLIAHHRFVQSISKHYTV